MTLGTLGTCETRMRETRGSADSGETGRRRTNAFWDTWDENAAKEAVRGVSAKNGTKGPFELGTFGTRKCEVRGSGVSADQGTECTFVLGT
ncbi:hypothetical protein KI387_011218, partial [Taxus chinensis]